MFSSKNESGISLVGVLVASGIAAIAALALLKSNNNRIAVSAKIRQDLDLQSILKTTFLSLDCDQTYLNNKTACDSEEYVRLYNRSGEPIMGELVAVDSSVFHGSGSIGDKGWFMRVNCDADGMEVEVAHSADGTGDPRNFSSDPLRANQLLSFSHPKSTIVERSQNLCANSFGITAPTNSNADVFSKFLVRQYYAGREYYNNKADWDNAGIFAGEIKLGETAVFTAQGSKILSSINTKMLLVEANRVAGGLYLDLMSGGALVERKPVLAPESFMDEHGINGPVESIGIPIAMTTLFDITPGVIYHFEVKGRLRDLGGLPAHFWMSTGPFRIVVEEFIN